MPVRFRSLDGPRSVVLLVLFSFVVQAAVAQSPKASSPAKSAIAFELERVRFELPPQGLKNHAVKTTRLRLVVDVRVTNQSSDSFWFDAPAPDEKVFPNRISPDVFNGYQTQLSIDGVRWYKRGSEGFTRIPKRIALKPDSSVVVSIPHSYEPRFQHLKLGVALASEKEKAASVVWSDTLDTSPRRICEMLDVFPPEEDAEANEVLRFEASALKDFLAKRKASRETLFGEKGCLKLLDSAAAEVEIEGRDDLTLVPLELDVVLPRDSAKLQLAIDAFPEISAVTIRARTGKQIEADAVKKLDQLPRLRTLTFVGDLTPETLVAAASLKPVHRWVIRHDERGFGPAAMARRANRELGKRPLPFESGLTDPMSKEAERQLAKLAPQVREIRFEDRSVSVSVVRALMKLPELQSFQIRGRNVEGLTVGDFRYIKEQPRLRTVVITPSIKGDEKLRREFQELDFEVEKRNERVDAFLAAVTRPALKAGSPEGSAEIPTLTMTEAEYGEFVARRQAISLDLFASPDIQARDSHDGLTVVSIKTPTRTVHLTGKSISCRKATTEQAGKLGAALDAFPETIRLDARLAPESDGIPALLMDGITRLPVLNSFGFSGDPASSKWTPELTAKLAACKELKSIQLGGDLTNDAAMANLAQLENVDSVSVSGDFTHTIFRAFAKMPKLKEIRITGTPKFAAEPIDDVTDRAIATMNGRPMRLMMFLGEYHPTFVRSMFQVHSADQFVLWWANPKGGTLEDFAGLESMTKLSNLRIKLPTDEDLQLAVEKEYAKAFQRDAATKARESRKALSKINGSLGKTTAQVDASVSKGQVDKWIQELASQEHGYNVKPTSVPAGDAVLKALLQRVFPESMASQSELKIEEVRKLIAQLDAASFEAREAATMKLSAGAREFIAELRTAQQAGSVEKRMRVKKILDGWSDVPAAIVSPQKQFTRGWTNYLHGQTGYSSDVIIAKTVVAALKRRVDQTNRKELLQACFFPLRKCKNAEVFDPFVPLCQHKDVNVPIFVLESLVYGSYGDFVSPFHKAAFASDRPELVKAAYANFPLHDPAYRLETRKWIERVFSEPVGDRPFSDDPVYLVRLARRGRQLNVPAANAFLVGSLGSKNSRVAQQVLRALLADGSNCNRPMPDEILTGCKQARLSSNSDVRMSVVRLAASHLGTDEVHSLLIDALADPDELVWQEAVNGLLRQMYLFKPRGKELDFIKPIQLLLTKELGEDLKERYATILKVIKKEADFDWVIRR